MFCPKTDKAPLTIVLRVLVLHLCVCRERKKGLCLRVHRFDDVGVNAMTRNGSETNGAIGSAKVIYKGLSLCCGAVGEVTQIERGNASDKIEVRD